ncbi:MAG: septum formation initiator family protein [Coriobacteriales bacterium]|jgi:cell division protein FtsB|nr:septum formation initiator family protein [Coriobacteriales bacterium]
MNMAKKNATENAAVRIPSALIVVVIIGLSLALAVVVLYPMTREYYLAQRGKDRLNAEYEMVVDRNEKIRQQIESLQTPEGIADRAREEFGWVQDGEEAVNITGLDVFESTTALPAAVEPGTAQAPETWLTRTLDEFFEVEDFVPTDPYPNEIVPGL